MLPRAGSLADGSLFEVIRSIHVERRTGVLQVDSQGVTRRILFVAGDVYLARSHPLAEEVDRLLEASLSAEQPQAAKQLYDFLDRMLEVMARWRDGTYGFEEGYEGLPAARVGPLPSDYLARSGSIQARAVRMWRDIGGRDATLAAVPGALAASSGTRLGREDAFLLSRLERPATVEDLLRETSLPREGVLETLCRLYEGGLVQRSAAAAAPPVTPATKPDDVTGRFVEVVGQDLLERPLDLSPDEHRGRLLSRLAGWTERNHYELLGVVPGDAPETVHEAFRELARLVHPCHAERLSLRLRAAPLELVFGRAVEAYLTLSDAERSREYRRREMLEEGGPAADRPAAADRAEERRRLARQQYERALALVAQDDPHHAVTLLEQAGRNDSRAEYFQLLARVQSLNPNWLHRAADSLARAVELSPEDLNLRLQLARTREELGDAEGARRAYRAALERAPDHAEARQGLERVGGEPRLRDRLKGLWGGGEER